ncbi:Cys-tRNA(Pro) deacylase [Demequina sp. NBRC 110057]|uniref:Cys-tRNA(Pro) deacylase n=1 Tax=Demequina sp. NBRC 110057 TaxID=1570346 RepID=UPI000A075E56|nr:Cys-tRNA(Pro) deacylase [Demequina sp. NBRC 110057]
MARTSPTGTPALALLEKEGVHHGVHPYEHDASSSLSYGLEAAEALGVSPREVFKTLCFLADGVLTIGIVPVSGSLDLKAAAKAVGAKRAVMADPADAERATGYVVGGISPLGGRKRLPAVLDSSAFDHDTVYVSGGRRGLDVSLAPADLVRLTGASTAPIGKDS